MAHLELFRFSNKSIGWRIVSSVALLLLMSGAYFFYPPLRARYLFRELQRLQVGHSTFEDAQRVAEKLGAKPYGSCERSHCFWYAAISNARLPQWWRGAGVTFIVTFSVNASRVDHKAVGYEIGIDPNAFIPSKVSVVVRDKWSRPMRGYIPPPTQKGWRISYFQKRDRRENISTTFEVRMTPESSADDWKRYTAFDYSCFSRYQGRKDGRDLLPTADPYSFDQ